MIPDDEYATWCRRHAATFGISIERLAETFAAWRRVFDLAGYAITELDEATTWLAAFEPPKFLTEHLGALQRRITAQRVLMARRNQELQEANDPACICCQGRGWVTVPKLASVIDGQWVALSGSTLPTSAVVCDCSAGQRIYDSHTKPGAKEKHKPPLRLFQYEARVPHWQSLMERKEDEWNARGAAQRAAQDATANGIVMDVAKSLKP